MAQERVHRLPPDEWAALSDDARAEFLRRLDAQKKRDRYHSDPEYRERRRLQQKAYRKRKRKERNKQQQRMRGKQVPRPKQRRPLRPRKMEITVSGDGRTRNVMMYTTGCLAIALDRTAQSIRLWERKGTLPPALFRDDRKRRLYTEDQFQGILDVFEACKGEMAFSWDESSIPKKLKELWASMPYGVKK